MLQFPIMQTSGRNFSEGKYCPHCHLVASIIGIFGPKKNSETLVKASEADVNHSHMKLSILTKNYMGNNTVQVYGFCHNTVAHYQGSTLAKILFG